MTEAAKRQANDVVRAALPVNTPRHAASTRLDMMLAAGGDERIWLDAVTRRNRYGTPTPPAPDEIWLSSSTASAISPRGYDAAGEALSRVTGDHPDLPAWFDELRARIRDQLGAPGVEVILTASGTEAEFAALAVARALLKRAVTNIVVAPEETGSGVPLAAIGAHFAATAAFEPHVEKGATLSGWAAGEVTMARVDLRDASGKPRAAVAVDREVCATVAQALGEGRDALLHVLDASKTGRSGPSRETARALAASAGDRLVVLVDACQLRCSFDQIRADLADGFLVMVTGSKFAGGPPFCGALLVPPEKAQRLRELRLPAGMAAYAARLDWPESLAGAFGASDFAPANLGMGLRWTAALAEIEAYASIPAPLRDNIFALFAETVRRGVASNADLDFLDAEMWRIAGKPATIFPIVTHKGDIAQARLIYESLRSVQDLGRPELTRVCHVGQPVIVGGRAALRLCLGMPHVTEIADRVANGADIQTAFLPLRRDMELVFRKWGALAKRIGAEGKLTIAASKEA